MPSLRGLLFLSARGLLWVVLCVCFLPVDAHSALLFDNGAVTGNSNLCDQGPTGCGGSGNWTYYDNFELGTAATITHFDFTDYMDQGIGSYVLTNWSIWDTDPYTALGPVASGSDTATAAVGAEPDQYVLEIDGLGVSLPMGVYWLGTNNQLLFDAVSSVAGAVGVLPGNKQSDGASNNFDDRGERAFRIFGVVPEPSSLLIAAGTLLVSLCRRTPKCRLR